MECLGASSALPSGRGDRAPPREPPSALSPAFLRKAILAGMVHPAEGRAPHARKGGITLTPTLPLLGHRLLGKAPVATQCLAIRPAAPCGRGDRAPPREPPSALSPAFPRKAILAGMVHPGRGGLRTPAVTPLDTLDHVPGRPPALRLPLGGHAIPGLSSGRTTRARGPRPSERTALHIIPGFSPKGLSPRLAPRGGAGPARPL